MKIYQIELNNNPYTLTIIKRKTSKKLSLKINQKTNQPQISIPFNVSYPKAIEFFKQSITWVEQRTLTKQVIDFSTCGFINILGEPHKIVDILGQRGRGRLNVDNLVIEITAKNPQHRAEVLIKFLKKHALDLCSLLSKEKSKQIGKSFNKIILMDSNKWGSCSTLGNLRYNFRIIMAPLYVVDYLVAHEVAHLQEFNHSSNFWLLASNLCKFAPLERGKNWLKQNGNSLY